MATREPLSGWHVYCQERVLVMYPWEIIADHYDDYKLHVIYSSTDYCYLTKING